MAEKLNRHFPRKIYRWPTGAWKVLNIANHQEVQVNTMVRYSTSHLWEWPSSKRSQIKSRWWGHAEKGTLVLCWWECNLMQPLWKTVCRFLKKLKIELFDPAISLWVVKKKKKKRLFQKMHARIHSSTIYNSQKEAT